METCIGRQQKISDWRNNKKLSEDKFMNRFEQVKGMEMPDAKKVPYGTFGRQGGDSF